VRVFVMMKRRRLRLVQHNEARHKNLDLAGRQIRVDRAFRAGADLALDLQDVFTANALGLGENLWRIRIEDDLQQSLPITQVDEYNAAVIPAPMHPAGYLDNLADGICHNNGFAWIET